MSWFKRAIAEENGIIAYHGSDATDIQALRSAMPAYPGGIGPGVYVGTERETAEFYGNHVYKVALNFNWDAVLQITPDTMSIIEPLEGTSLLVGEEVAPFTFYIGKQAYAVLGDSEADHWLAESARAAYMQDTINEDYEWWCPLVQEALPTLEEGDTEVEWAEIASTALRSHPQFVQAVREALSQGGSLDDIGREHADLLEETDDTRGADVAMINVIAQAIEGLCTAITSSDPYGEPIGMEDIGPLAQEHGFKAVFFEGARARSSVNEEMLVFNPKDIVVIGKIS